MGHSEYVVYAAAVTGILALVLGIVNLYFNLRAGRRSAFVNTVTSERIKWIGKVRENISKLLALCERWVFQRPESEAELHREMEQLKIEIRLQLNPKDKEDKSIEELLERLPNRVQSISSEDYLELRNSLTIATQSLLKREWDKVKDEAIRGDLRKGDWLSDMAFQIELVFSRRRRQLISIEERVKLLETRIVSTHHRRAIQALHRGADSTSSSRRSI